MQLLSARLITIANGKTYTQKNSPEAKMEQKWGVGIMGTQ